MRITTIMREHETREGSAIDNRKGQYSRAGTFRVVSVE